MLVGRAAKWFSGYRPLRPLNATGRTLLFKRNYKPSKAWIWSIPAVAILGNNLLTGFSALNIGMLAMAAMIASYMHFRTKTAAARNPVTISTNRKFDRLWVEVEPYEKFVSFGYINRATGLLVIEFDRVDIIKICDTNTAEPIDTFEQAAKKNVTIIASNKTDFPYPYMLHLQLMDNTEVRHQDYLLALITKRNVILDR